MKSLMIATVAALAFLSGAKADTVTYTAPGTKLVGPVDTISGVSVAYDGNRVDGRYSVAAKVGTRTRTLARFATAADAYNYAASVYASNGPYSVSNFNGIKTTVREGDLKALPEGVAGVIDSDVRDPNSPWSKHYTVHRVIKTAQDNDAVASFGSKTTKASPAKASGSRSGGVAGGFGSH